MSKDQRPKDPAQDGIPRLIYLKRILQLCIFPVVTVVLGNVVILAVPQARETLLAFDEVKVLSSQGGFFILAFLLWMISAWYITRLLVGKRFQPDLVGRCSSPNFSTGVTKHLPRWLALVAGLPIAIALTLQGKPKALGGLLLALSAVVFGFLVFRRNLGRMLQQSWVDNSPTDDRSWLCTRTSGPDADPLRHEARHNFIVPAAKNGRLFLPDILAPLDGAFSTRGGRAATAEIDLLRLVAEPYCDHVAELRLPRPAKGSEREPSMNGMLNDASRKQMDGVLDAPGAASGAHVSLEENLALVRSWIR